MRRGTAPTHTFSVDVDLREAQVYVTYSQGGKLAFEKTGEDVSVAEDVITVRLTQKDTLALAAGYPVLIQIRYVMPDGTAGASDIMGTMVDGVLKDGEIEYADG